LLWRVGSDARFYVSQSLFVSVDYLVLDATDGFN